MRIVIFGLSVSSAWGNGHATLHRGLLRALHSLGHEVHFFERNTPYYEAHRDAPSLPYAHLHLYNDWIENLPQAKQAVMDADVAVVTSYCPDGIAASDLISEHRSHLRSVFYDMDTPVTLDKVSNNEEVPYLPPTGLNEFDLTLSYTGGIALQHLRDKLGSRCAASLYGWVDPRIHHRVSAKQEFECNFSYLGTYAADRQDALESLMIGPARRLPHRRFVIAGAMYPEPRQWPANIRHFAHLAPPKHPAFYSSSPLTLSVTRGTMAALGYCPSGRLFEAAACGTAVLSDWWEGIESFFQPDEEILLASTSDQALEVLSRNPGDIQRIGERAKERALDCHTAEIRARRLIQLIEDPMDDDDAITSHSTSNAIVKPATAAIGSNP